MYSELSGCWGVRLPRHIWDVENSRVRISPFRLNKEKGYDNVFNSFHDSNDVMFVNANSINHLGI